MQKAAEEITAGWIQVICSHCGRSLEYNNSELDKPDIRSFRSTTGGSYSTMFWRMDFHETLPQHSRRGSDPKMWKLGGLGPLIFEGRDFEIFSSTLNISKMGRAICMCTCWLCGWLTVNTVLSVLFNVNAIYHTWQAHTKTPEHGWQDSIDSSESTSDAREEGYKHYTAADK